MKSINQAYLFFLMALLLFFCTGCDLIPSWKSIYVVNRSSTEQVALLAVIVDGVKLDYQDTKLPTQKYLKKPGEFKSRPQLHHIDLWVKKENAPAEKYSCKIQSISGGCIIVFNYYDTGIKCGVCFEESSGY